jgi:predicted RNA-binding protein associated with RNAse of E/G family
MSAKKQRWIISLKPELGIEVNMEKTLVVWRRLGKEHGEHSGFRVNTPDVVKRHLRDKVERFRATADPEWRWWRISEDIIIERPIVTGEIQIVSDRTVIYYLLDKNWVIIQDVIYPGFGSDWPWYIHIGDVTFDDRLDCFVMRDLFCDVLVRANCSDHTVLDLDELGKAHQLGLVTGDDVLTSLSSTQELIDQIRGGMFPPPEVARCQEAVKSLRWGGKV